ncbi:DUF2141 domain-containing protein [Flavobacterium sedimenticola]|uniref:DUF2141 domain-containing protein n=1 Tax=Flavobacterium sedimenticola TaxID=3043286 RepID=A0ABT6XSY5_9FLAO|nr:DUF2141 domain-containing protein [Flavobacterium sedimenticola]MDI9257912.1 DUF2141 domain-containing protein [Flavobacterium sedimenticola]
MKTDKKILLTLIFSFFKSTLFFGQEAKQIVKIDNLENKKGILYIGWYNQSSSFRINDKAIYKQKVSVNNQKELSVIFNDIPKGKYAVAVFLDENNNYKLDKNFLGIPKEKYGFSNNVLPSLRPATFDESAFELNGKETTIINITLK